MAFTKSSTVLSIVTITLIISVTARACPYPPQPTPGPSPPQPTPCPSPPLVPPPSPLVPPSEPPQSLSTPSKNATCPKDALKFGVCAKLLYGGIGTVIGDPPTTPCCIMLGEMADLEAAVCLCTALKANIMGMNIDIPITLTMLINTCGKTLPYNYFCPVN